MAKHIYLFSGLGADHRVFQYMDFTDYEITHIQWVQPQRDDSLSTYAHKLAPQITTPEPIFIGVSFGGIVAIELAKLIHTQKIIIISSIKSRLEIPFHYKLLGALKLQLLIPDNFLIRPNSFLHWQFGIEQPDHKQLLKEILQDTDVSFLKWALGKIASWSNDVSHENLIHIHGSNDHVLPYPLLKCHFTIQDGGHFMMINKADEIAPLLRKLLD